MNRRYFIESFVMFGVAATTLSPPALFTSFAQKKEKTKARVPLNKVIKSDEEWKRILTPDQYFITRQAGTEAPYSSPLLNIHDSGTFECVCCDLPLFSSKTKFDSGTGWPSFGLRLTSEMSSNELTTRSPKRVPRFSVRDAMRILAMSSMMGQCLPACATA